MGPQEMRLEGYSEINDKIKTFKGNKQHMKGGMTPPGLWDRTIAVVVEMDKFQGFLRSRIVRTVWVWEVKKKKLTGC